MQMESRTLKPSFFSLLLLLLLISSLCHATVVDETCRTIARARPRISYDFCVASLQADPACGAAADRRGLAMIATRQSLARATAVVSAITNMTRVQSVGSTSLQEWLGVCSEVFDEAVDHLNVAMRSLGYRKYREAVTFLSAAVDAPENCEDAFKETGGAAASPLSHVDGDYGRVAAVALAITASLR